MSPRPHVVLVQGFFTSPRSLEVLVDHLERLERPCSIPSLGGFRRLWQTEGVEPTGTALATYLRGLPSDVKPWIIGHSIGGIIARYAVQMAGAGDRVSGVLTIGAPHRGTPTAVAGLVMGLGLLSKAPFDIIPLSRMVRRLNGAPWPEAIPLVSVASRADLLCPALFSRAKLQGASVVRNVVLSKLGHTELVRTDWVLDALCDLMADPRAVVPQEV